MRVGALHKKEFVNRGCSPIWVGALIKMDFCLSLSCVCDWWSSFLLLYLLHYHNYKYKLSNNTLNIKNGLSFRTHWFTPPTPPPTLSVPLCLTTIITTAECYINGSWSYVHFTPIILIDSTRIKLNTNLKVRPIMIKICISHKKNHINLLKGW